MTSSRLTLRTYILLHVVAAVIGIAALWLFFFPTDPVEAVADGITAAAAAGYVELVAMRLGG